jgi:hypothetical protein
MEVLVVYDKDELNQAFDVSPREASLMFGEYGNLRLPYIRNYDKISEDGVVEQAVSGTLRKK